MGRRRGVPHDVENRPSADRRHVRVAAQARGVYGRKDLLEHERVVLCLLATLDHQWRTGGLESASEAEAVAFDGAQKIRLGFDDPAVDDEEQPSWRMARGPLTEDFFESRVLSRKEICGEDDRIAERDLNRLLLDIVHVPSSGNGKSPCQPASRQGSHQNRRAINRPGVHRAEHCVDQHQREHARPDGLPDPVGGRAPPAPPDRAAAAGHRAERSRARPAGDTPRPAPPMLSHKSASKTNNKDIRAKLAAARFPPWTSPRLTVVTAVM